MALSGANNGGGGFGGSYLRLEWSASQNHGANTSTISARLYLVLQGYTSISATESGDINIDGAQYTFSRGTTNRGPNGTHHLHSATRTIGHNNNGTRSFSIGGYFRSGWTTFGRINVGMNGWTLNTIPRYANINSWSLGGVTEKSINVSVSTDSTVDLVDYSINGSGWTRGYTGNFTSRTFTISNLQPATQYSIKIRVRRQASGLYRETGLKSATTRAVTITSATVPQATDTSLSIRAVTSHVANLLQYRLSGSSTWINAYSGDFTTANFTIPGLSANQSYTYQLRARHKDSGAYTPIVNVTGTTGDPQPLQPTNLAPANALGISTVTPTLSWQYNATSPDSPTAYQIIIRRESDGATVHDSGKITSNASNYQVPASTLQFNENYQWQIRTWSGTDLAGPYSEIALFKTSQKPVVTVETPQDQDVAPTGSPTITWTYSDPEGTPQIGFRVIVHQINETGETSGQVVVDEATNNSDATAYTLPADSLSNGGRYIVFVEATDSDGVTGVSDPVEFTVEFVAPEPPSINLELSEDVLFTRINANSNKPANDAYEADTFRIYRRELGQSEWLPLGEVSPQYSPIANFDDAGAWTAEQATASVEEDDNSKQGSNSISIINTASGLTQISRDSASGTLDGYDRIRVWIRPITASDIDYVRFKLGADEDNYYFFDVTTAELEDGVWASIEVSLNTLSSQGTPSTSSVVWVGVEVDANTALAEGDLLVDGLRGVGVAGSTFVYDYELANGKTYEYAASAFNSQSNLESAIVVAEEPIVIEYDPWVNTYLIPVYAQDEAVVGFMEGKQLPTWQTITDTAYHQPVNSRYPVAYSRGEQKYRKGSLLMLFLDEKFDGDGLKGDEKLRRIMNYKPIMLRTWWGEILYISIDGQVGASRRKGIGWDSNLSFTEVASE